MRCDRHLRAVRAHIGFNSQMLATGKVEALPSSKRLHEFDYWPSPWLPVCRSLNTDDVSVCLAGFRPVDNEMQHLMARRQIGRRF